MESRRITKKTPMWAKNSKKFKQMGKADKFPWQLINVNAIIQKSSKKHVKGANFNENTSMLAQKSKKD